MAAGTYQLSLVFHNTAVRLHSKRMWGAATPSLPSPSLPFPSLPFPSLPFPSLALPCLEGGGASGKKGTT